MGFGPHDTIRLTPGLGSENRIEWPTQGGAWPLGS